MFPIVISCLLLAGHSVPKIQQRPALQPSSPRLCRTPYPTPIVPTYSHSIDLSSLLGCGASVPGPFGGALSPDGRYLYVSLIGTFSANNCFLAKIDTQTDQLVGSLSVGHYPEEIVFTTDSNGQMQYGFVSNSSDSTITVFNAQDQILPNAIQIPDVMGFGTGYPFGLALSPDQSRLYVGTVDGSGSVYVIDTQTLSLLPEETIPIPGSHGRLFFLGSTLIVPSSEFHSDFSGSEARLVLVDRPQQQAITHSWIINSATGSFPSAQDFALSCHGLGYLVGTDLDSQIHVFDWQHREFLEPIDSHTGSGLHQGIGLSKDGLMAVGDLATAELSFFNAWNQEWLETISLSSHFADQISELIFSRNGKKLYVIAQDHNSLLVFERP